METVIVPASQNPGLSVNVQEVTSGEAGRGSVRLQIDGISSVPFPPNVTAAEVSAMLAALPYYRIKTHTVDIGAMLAALPN